MTTITVPRSTGGWGVPKARGRSVVARRQWGPQGVGVPPPSTTETSVPEDRTTLLTARDVATRLRVSVNQAYVVMKSMAFVKFGASIRVFEGEFTRWIDQQTKGPWERFLRRTVRGAPSKYYYARLDGEREDSPLRSTKCTQKAAAEIVANRWEVERADPDNAAKNQARFDVEARVYLDVCRARVANGTMAAGTLEMYESKTGNLGGLLPALMKEVDAVAVDTYFETRRGEGAALGSLYKEWITLHKILRSAKRRRKWSGELDTLRPEWVTPGYTPRERFLPFHEIEAVMCELPKHRAAVLAFILATSSPAQ